MDVFYQTGSKCYLGVVLQTINFWSWSVRVGLWGTTPPPPRRRELCACCVDAHSEYLPALLWERERGRECSPPVVFSTILAGLLYLKKRKSTHLPLLLKDLFASDHLTGALGLPNFSISNIFWSFIDPAPMKRYFTGCAYCYCFWQYLCLRLSLLCPSFGSGFHPFKSCRSGGGLNFNKVQILWFSQQHKLTSLSAHAALSLSLGMGNGWIGRLSRGYRLLVVWDRGGLSWWWIVVAADYGLWLQ